MTGDKLSQAISAVKIINEVTNTMYKLDINNKAYCKRIQGCLETLTDFLQDVFIDMVNMNNVTERLAELNGKVEEHLKK